MSIRNRILLGIGGLLAGSVFSAIDWLVLDTVRTVAFLNIPLYGILGFIVGMVLDRLRDNNQRMHRSYRSSLDALANAVAAKDDETNGHCRRVVQYAMLIGRELGLGAKLMQQLEWGALLHDIGKIAVPDAILKKPGPLTDDEWTVMREHPYMGYLMIKDIEFLKEGRDVILHHHERMDGRGYPHGLAGTEIPMLARIFAIADTFDAITSDRPYRKAQSIEMARDEIRKHSGVQFCDACVAAFLRIPHEELVRVQEESKVLDYEAIQLKKLKNIS